MNTFAILGLGISGQATARYLLDRHINVLAWDDSSEARAANERQGIPIHDLTECDWSSIKALILSPGIPHTWPVPHPIVALARQNKVPIYSDIELLIHFNPQARIIGITGTNGKSTTTALIDHLLTKANIPHATGGNLGPAALSLPSLGIDGYYVLELSSYQLEITPSLRCDIAVLLNITPDHLDHHGGMNGYIAAKKRIFQQMGTGHTAIIGVDDLYSHDIYQSLQRHRTFTTLPLTLHDVPLTHGITVKNGSLIDHDVGRPPLDLTHLPTLRGVHNWQNAAAAYAVGRSLGIESSLIQEALISFPGLAHRQEHIKTLNGISFINDSKATNMDAAAKALASYDTIYWIAGGRGKGESILRLRPYFPKIRRVFLIGEMAEPFAEELQGELPVTLSGTLTEATRQAYQQARADNLSDATILLSPACTSFDQFKNFAERGETFRSLTYSLEPA